MQTFINTLIMECPEQYLLFKIFTKTTFFT